MGMALLDYVPVLLFLVTAVLLQRDLYDRMSKGAFALLCAGTIMTILAGTFKATWKLLYNLNLCDFEALNRCFFPMQASGFLLSGIALVALSFFPQKKTKTYALLAVPVFSGTMIFVIAMVTGVLGLCTGLSVLAVREKRKHCVILFVLSFVFMLGMGYLSSRDFSKEMMNWIAELVNILGQGFLLLGVLDMHRHKKKTGNSESIA